MDGGRMASREARAFASDPLFGATNPNPRDRKLMRPPRSRRSRAGSLGFARSRACRGSWGEPWGDEEKRGCVRGAHLVLGGGHGGDATAMRITRRLRAADRLSCERRGRSRSSSRRARPWRTCEGWRREGVRANTRASRCGARDREEVYTSRSRDGDDRTCPVSRQISPANISRDSTSGVPDELNAIRFPENFRVTLSKTARS